MAIVNTLQKCLDSPYLFRDEEAPARVASLLKLATERLEAATNLHSAEKPDAADVGSMAYESMFAALRALVYARGYREAGLRCLLLACEQYYVRPGLLDPRYLVDFERSQGQKLAPAEALASARGFVEKARELVGS